MYVVCALLRNAMTYLYGFLPGAANSRGIFPVIDLKAKKINIENILFFKVHVCILVNMGLPI